MDNFTPPLYFEYFALLLWGISGAIVGWRKGYDVVGVFVIAFVSSFGGGLLRAHKLRIKLRSEEHTSELQSH